MRIPKNNVDVANILDRLIQHPFQDIGARRCQQIGKYKTIRYLKQKGVIKIGNGSIGVLQGFQLVKGKHGYKIKTRR